MGLPEPPKFVAVESWRNLHVAFSLDFSRSENAWNRSVACLLTSLKNEHRRCPASGHVDSRGLNLSRKQCDNLEGSILWQSGTLRNHSQSIRTANGAPPFYLLAFFPWFLHHIAIFNRRKNRKGGETSAPGVGPGWTRSNRSHGSHRVHLSSSCTRSIHLSLQDFPSALQPTIHL